ncbi:peptidoglycan-binding protein [Knoellia flava TL1]|uniref:Peptidoglycan-binding protein n=2 Tax=Knoellia flava TaxID=913969 RepID=A0A8H9KRU6_9MICO|nr:L,D-transpeptidase family protein [Knoellia flava]KGN30123.1 peptidoglycan-binding protein [Knoellia flava TL1]GGB72728.1 peptidoglycan-binding protein [Knoellia flava]
MDDTGHGVSRRAALVGGVGASVLGASALAATTAEAATRPVLVLGSRGPAVTEAQERLRALGYWVGTPDGTFGHVTQQAVWALQKSAGARRSGRIDLAAWGLLARGFTPRPRATSGTLIEVDLKKQILMVVSNGRLVHTLNTSTGSGERYYSGGSWKTARTPTGSYSIYWRWSNGWQTGSLGSMWRPTYWRGDFAIHGSQSIPPYPASHGCCRVSTAAQDMLWAGGWVALNRRVVLY